MNYQSPFIKRPLSTLAVLIAVATLSITGFAETEGTVHLGKSEVSKQQIIELLSPSAGGMPKTRGLRLHSSEPAASVTESAARALSLEVYFEFDSANLTAEAMQQLAPVGQALESNELANVEFTLEGHTDA